MQFIHDFKEVVVFLHFKINPKALEWARIDAGYGYSNLPNKIKPKYKDWESGKVMPTWNQLKDISRYFKRPTAFFFREKLPEHTNIEFIEYRKLNRFQNPQKSPTLTLAIREALSKRKTFLELIEDMHYPKTSFSIFQKNSRNALELATRIRDTLDVDLKKQKSWLYNNGRRHCTLQFPQQLERQCQFKMWRFDF